MKFCPNIRSFFSNSHNTSFHPTRQIALAPVNSALGGIGTMRTRTTLSLLIIATLSGCGDECREYSDFSCKEIERAPYNVYFYYPSGGEEYLGQADGLSQCGSLAHGFASSKNLSGNGEWSYICCMRAKGSECYEKHR